MRKIVFSALLVLFLSFGSAEGLAPEKSYITGEGSNLNNSVVVEVGAMAQTATPVQLRPQTLTSFSACKCRLPRCV